MKTNLFNFNLPMLEKFFMEQGEPRFRAKQLMKWVYHEKVLEFDHMTNLSKSLRDKLNQTSQLELPKVVFDKTSKDGTRKLLLQLSGGNSIETVFIPEKSRGTLCVSSQVGCTLNCRFCSTGKQGYNRDLTTAEIISQVWMAAKLLSDTPSAFFNRITNVVMMGMGEPLYNYDNVVTAIDLMMDDFAFGLSKRKVTLSTSGVVPKMIELKKRTDVSLAVSLHAPNNDLRDVLVPLNRKYPIEPLMDVCRSYFAGEAKRSVTFEYVMLDGVNDQPEHARQLVKLLGDMPCKVNLIPFNPFPGSGYARSSSEVIEHFQDILYAAGIRTTTRRTRGDDIDAACGQLVGQVNDRTKRNLRYQQQLAENTQHF